MRVAMFRLAPPRHPLARAGLALVGVGILALLAALGVAIAAVVIGVLAVRAGIRRLSGPASAGRVRPVAPQVIDGEYRVVESSRLLVR